jgi:hypothetical protein
MNGCQWVTILGRLGGCIYVLGVPWGVLHLALHEILLGWEANLVSIKSVSSRFSWIAALPCRRHTSHARTPNNVNSVSSCVTWNYLQLRYSFLSLEMKIRSPNQPWKTISSDFGLTAQQGFGGPYLLAPWSEFGLPQVQIEGIVEAHNFGSQTFSIKARLSLWICTKRSCCLGLREYLSGWVDLVGKHPSSRSFAYWRFGHWVVWSLDHFVSWLVTGFMIFSWSA